MKKLKLLAIMLCAMFTIIGVVSAAEKEYPTVTNATATDSFTGSNVEDIIKVEGSETDNVIVTVDGGSWSLLDDKSDVSRPDGYTWIGLKFEMPESVSNVKIDGSDETLSDGKTFTEYFGFNATELEESVKAGIDLTKTFTLTYTSGDKEKTQTITIIVKAENITITDATDDGNSATVWDNTKYEEVYAEGVEERTHNVIVKESKNGTVSAPETALEGEEVTLTVTPDKGYKLDKLVVTDSEGNKIEVTDNTFIMPTDDVTVTATFVKATTVTTNNPNTGDINLVLIVSLVITALIGILFVKRKLSAKAN